MSFLSLVPCTPSEVGVIQHMGQDSDICRRLHNGYCSEHHAGVMPALYLDDLVGKAAVINGLLGLCDGGSGLECHSENNGHSAGNAAQDTAVVIGLGLYMAVVVNIEIVVVLAAQHF